MNAPSFRRFGRFPGMGLIVLCLGVLLAACGDDHNAELVVTGCTDQDGAPLSDAVMITVDGTSKNWKPGETVRFPLQVESDAKTVRVQARAGSNYTYASQPAFTLVPGETRTLNLRFMRPYVITVQALGLSDMPLADVEVYAENQRVGATDEQGTFTWSFTEAARAGDKIDLILQKGNETTTLPSIILRQNVFSYDTEGRLPLHGAPESMLATTPDAASPQDEDTAPPTDQTPATTSQPPAAPAASPSRPDDDATPSTPPERAVAERSTSPPAPERTSEPEGTPAPETIPATAVASEPASSSSTGTPGTAEGTLLHQGDLARRRGAFREAVGYYEQVPLSNRDAYKKARHHIGEIYFREMQPHDYQRAIQAFQAVLEADHSEYAAHHNLAAVYLEIDALDEAEEHLNRVLALKHRIPLAQRRRVEREARYRLALIQFARFENERVPDNKFERGLLAQSALQRFIDAVPSGETAFAAKRRDAQQRITTIRQWIDQSR